VHDLDAFEALEDQARDHHIGRRLSDNEELEDAPETAHVKRTAQESFDPEAFVLRRSMPWMMSMQAGLMFVAFGKSFYAFEAQMKRMAGYDDGVTDAMFKISRPVNGAYFWCPPMREGRLDLRRLGLGVS
jgi:putative iron-dependent peroxidase